MAKVWTGIIMVPLKDEDEMQTTSIVHFAIFIAVFYDIHTNAFWIALDQVLCDEIEKIMLILLFLFL